MTETQLQQVGGLAEKSIVRLVDCDIHPVMPRHVRLERLSSRWRRHYEQFGRRTPLVTELYPRASNGGMRADAWPDEPGSFPGSNLGLLQRQLLDEYDVDYGVLNSLGLLGCHEMPEFAAELARVENDWLCGGVARQGPTPARIDRRALRASGAERPRDRAMRHGSPVGAGHPCRHGRGTAWKQQVLADLRGRGGARTPGGRAHRRARRRSRGPAGSRTTSRSTLPPRSSCRTGS